MAIVVVGGQARKVGKTSVITGFISALPACNWTAIKITPHEHKPGAAKPFTVSEELYTSTETDTGRYLAAGAKKALLLSVGQARLVDAMPHLQRAIASSQNVLIESNSIIEHLKPDIFMVVMDPAIAEVKESMRRVLPQANAIVIAPKREDRELSAEVEKLVKGKLRFEVAPPSYVTKDLLDFVRRHLTRVREPETAV
jgi:molybdopterin-guanine dinucleotide biosynthesis protein